MGQKMAGFDVKIASVGGSWHGTVCSLIAVMIAAGIESALSHYYLGGGDWGISTDGS